ncbi:unnamed protein product [Orchesella dallaii]|uniref:Protein kinase domain-containing protein n=1 Tax=Orchesella dallaii TaxID=48710 RepID=A0ABP1RI94_9HEXA
MALNISKRIGNTCQIGQHKIRSCYTFLKRLTSRQREVPIRLTNKWDGGDSRTDTIIVNENSFMEKISFLNSSSPDKLKTNEEKKEAESTKVPTIFWIVLSIVIVIMLLLGGVAIIILYQKVRNVETRRLSKEDHDEFMEGSTLSGQVGETSENYSEMLRLPYDKQQYELSKNSFTIDYTKLLGSGAFGFVYKGRIHDLGKDCAFKLTQASCSIATLKGLLSEIKILSYLGKHENIVSLIGSYTEELRNGIVYVVTELCDGGSLEKFLRAQQQEYKNVAKPAFGITMWEIFSVGDVPYPRLSWNVGFVGELQKGLRLQRPQYSSDEIYNLMLECWHPDPTYRISFSKMKCTLTNLASSK